MNEILFFIPCLFLVFLFLVYCVIQLEQWWRDKAYEGSLEQRYRDAKQAGFDDAQKEMEGQLKDFMDQMKIDLENRIFLTYGHKAEFLYEKECAINMITGQKQVVKYFKYNPVSLRMTLKPQKEFVTKMEWDMEVGTEERMK